jgi:hypothetical protein
MLKFENNKVLNARAMNFKIVSELVKHPLYAYYDHNGYLDDDLLHRDLDRRELYTLDRYFCLCDDNYEEDGSDDDND